MSAHFASREATLAEAADYAGGCHRHLDTLHLRPPDPDFAKDIGAQDFVKLVMRLLGSGARSKAKRLGVSYRFLFMKASGSQLCEITPLIDSGAIRSLIDKVFPFESTNEAMTYVEKGRAKGKVVIKIESDFPPIPGVSVKIENAVAPVNTGANRGIGLAFARELLARGAGKVYAGAHAPATATVRAFGHYDSTSPIRTTWRPQERRT